MFSLTRVFFLSFGILSVMLIPFFWWAIKYDYIALENFIIHLSMSELVGYPIPELLGASKEQTLPQRISLLENLFGIVLFCYGIFFISISFFQSDAKRWKWVFLSVGIPSFIVLVLFWLKFNQDDHIVGGFEKRQLFEFTFSLIIVTSICTFFGLKKPRVKKRKKLAAKHIKVGKVDTMPETSISPKNPDTEQSENIGETEKVSQELESGLATTEGDSSKLVEEEQINPSEEEQSAADERELKSRESEDDSLNDKLETEDTGMDTYAEIVPNDAEGVEEKAEPSPMEEIADLDESQEMEEKPEKESQPEQLTDQGMNEDRNPEAGNQPEEPAEIENTLNP